MSQSDFPVLRITVIGAAKAGKTSLISSFVNNSATPRNYTPTEYCSLYYRVYRLPPEEDEKGKLQSLVVEVEDTFSSNRGYNVKALFDMTKTPIQADVFSKGLVPFGFTPPPLAPLMPREKFFPITPGRMGLFLVFDSHSNASFDEALNLHASLNDQLEKKNEKLRPVVFLVATKIDKDIESATYQSIITQAEVYSQTMMMKLWKVSSVDGKNIKHMFEDMMRLIFGNEIMWRVEIEEAPEPEEKTCAVM
eukprot:GHVS01085377.1.p1 GENE.GHVS01085377.1~~GHVS01085377.1.p1  ORF type:complete len:250 (+),score=41.36 GHVS01085377.1:46-795(+)